MSKSVVAFAFILLILPNSAAYAGLSEQSSLLAPGEVKLEVVGKGTSKTRADKATITLTLRCSGSSAAEARSEARTTAERLKTELIKGGVPAQAISIEPPTTNRSSFVGNEAIADLVANAGGAASPKPQPYYSSLQMKVVLMNLSLLPKAREVIEGESVTTNVSPTLELNNIQAARNEAIQDAVRNARADAEAYAATTGMRVARITSIRDHSAQTMLFPDYEEMLTRFTPGNLSSDEVQTTVKVVVEFAMLPR